MATVVADADADRHRILADAAALLREDPEKAGADAERLLAADPGCDAARLILAVSLRLRGRPADALVTIEPAAARHPEDEHMRHELALDLGAVGRGDDAIAVLEALLDEHPEFSPAWRTLGDQRAAAGDGAGSQAAFDRHLETSVRHPELAEATRLLSAGRLAEAERLTRDVLKKDPLDTFAIRLLAALALRIGRTEDAIGLLERCLELSPDFQLARHNYAMALARRQRFDEAILQIDRLLRAEPRNPNYLLAKGTCLVQKGDFEDALDILEDVVAAYPNQAGAQMNFGHALKAVGRLDESVGAYRHAIGLRPATGEAYWSLANLKTFRFEEADVERMRAELDDDGDPDDQAHLLFALGKALEDRGDYDEAFRCYERGNIVRSKHHRHSPKINIFNTARQMNTLTAEFFAERQAWGHPETDPIFIVGLPRAGSTLLEQILSSHSAIEGTAELPDIIALSRKLAHRSREHPAGDYPEALAALTRKQVAELGQSYISTTRVQRHGLPYFIDKMPNNFQHIGLIHLILPNSKIIDARRHPMASCFSNFKQLFARGQTFTYSLTDLGLYYRDYVTLMDHWDAVLPGRVHRVQYEEMVLDTEHQVRALLDYCGLPFEEQCLRFYETRRAIRTPSSEQVRRPVYTEGLDQWRKFDKHLSPLKKALGPVLQRYPVE